jgi:transcriptional regulator with XRE-family HTH domain
MIGALLKEHRQKNNLTQKALSEKSGISFVSINRIEKGNLPRLSVAYKLFESMGLNLKLTIENSVS